MPIEAKSLENRDKTKPLIVTIARDKHKLFGKNQASKIAEFFRDATGVPFPKEYCDVSYWDKLCNGRFRSERTVRVVANEVGTNTQTGRTLHQIVQLQPSSFCAGKCPEPNQTERAEWGIDGLRCFCSCGGKAI